MTESINAKALDILKNSEQIFSPEQIRKAITDVAAKLNHDFDIPDVKTPPLVLSIMGGAAIFTGQLLPYLTFPLEFDFIHVSRYGNEEYGGEFIWKVIPRQNVINRTVIVLDDILDEGQTLLPFLQTNRQAQQNRSGPITSVWMYLTSSLSALEWI